MENAKLRHVVGRTVLATLISLGVVAASLSLAHAGEWHNGHWGHWGWAHGVRVFVIEPYPYGYYAPPPAYYPPPPPPVYYAPPPPPMIIGPSFGVFVGVH